MSRYAINYLPFLEAPNGTPSDAIIGYDTRCKNCGSHHGSMHEPFDTYDAAKSRLDALTAAEVVERGEIWESTGSGMAHKILFGYTHPSSNREE